MSDLLSPHFAASEFHKGRGWAADDSRARYVVLAEKYLEPLRAELGKPIVIVSGERSPEHNQRVKGAPSSRHLPPSARALASLRRENSAAADVRVPGLSPRQVADVALRLMREGRMGHGGVGVYETFVHLDSRGVIVKFR